MNTFQLSCFWVTADSLSLARAARRLHVTRAAVAYQIKSLEQELDVQLLVRKPRGIELTPAGACFLEDARSILSLEEQAKIRLDCLKGPEA